jgi:serine/threonine-protein kinase RsbW
LAFSAANPVLRRSPESAVTQSNRQLPQGDRSLQISATAARRTRWCSIRTPNKLDRVRSVALGRTLGSALVKFAATRKSATPSEQARLAPHEAGFRPQPSVRPRNAISPVNKILATRVATLMSAIRRPTGGSASPLVVPNVRLELLSRPENPLLVREMLSGLAESVGLSESELRDIRTAVSEACNNVVQHAYPQAEGPLEVDVGLAENRLDVVVRDRGCGVRPRISSAPAGGFGLGIPLIQALAERVQFGGAMGVGTEVKMTFATPGVREFGISHQNGLRPDVTAGAEPTSAVLITLMPALLARTILARLLSELSARAHFSAERIPDSRSLADALAGSAPAPDSEDRVNVAIFLMSRKLSLRLGPLPADRARELISHPALVRVAQVLEPTAADGSVADPERSQILMLTLAEPHRPVKRRAPP